MCVRILGTGFQLSTNEDASISKTKIEAKINTMKSEIRNPKSEHTSISGKCSDEYNLSYGSVQ